MRKKRLFLKLIIFLVPFLLLSFFAYEYFVKSKHKFVVEYDFCRSSNAKFSGLSPIGRVDRVDTSICAQKMYIDPVYYDVKTPRKYDELEIIVDYESDVEFKIGVAKNISKWEWMFENPYIIDYNDRKQAIFAFDLSDIGFTNSLRFIISSGDLRLDNNQDKERSIVFHNIKLVFRNEAKNK